MTTVHVVEHREILHIPGPGQQHNMETVVMHVASSREKAVAWIKATDWTGDDGYLAVSEETVDNIDLALASEHLEFYDFSGNLLSDQPCSVDRWYVLSLEHTQGRNNALSWWGPNRSGYYLALEDAGVYTEAEAKQIAEDSKYTTDQGFAYLEVAISAGHANRIAKSIVPFDIETLADLDAKEEWFNRLKYAR